MQWESSLSTRPADDCSCAFTSHAVLPSVRKLWGDIWVTAGYEVENQNPPECRPSAGGGTSSVSARVTSHWTPSEAKVCGQISSHNGQDDKQQPQSHALCTLTHRRGKYARSSRPIATFLSSLGGFMVRTSWMWTLWRHFIALFMTEQGQYVWGKQIQSDRGDPLDRPLVDGWIMTSLCNIYIVLLWPFKNKRNCDDSQVRSDDQNSKKDGFHFLVALNVIVRTSILGFLASTFASSGTWNLSMSKVFVWWCQGAPCDQMWSGTHSYLHSVLYENLMRAPSLFDMNDRVKHAHLVLFT